MHADKVAISWDTSKHKWLVRIEAGSEAIRRHCKLPQDAGEDQLRASAQQTVVDEGYDFEAARIAVLK